MKSDLVDVLVRVVRVVRDKPSWSSSTRTAKKCGCLDPRSQIDYDSKNSRLATVTLPEWLAIKKELI